MMSHQVSLKFSPTTLPILRAFFLKLGMACIVVVWICSNSLAHAESASKSKVENTSDFHETLKPSSLFDPNALFGTFSKALTHRSIFTESLLDIASRSAPLVRSAQAQVRAADANVGAAWSAFGPTVSLTYAQHIENRDQPGTSSDTDMSGNQFVASVTQPVFSFGSNYFTLQQHYSLRESLEIRERGEVAKALAKNLRALHNIIAENKKLKIYDYALNFQKELVRLETQKIEAGGGNRKELIAARGEQEQLVGLMSISKALSIQELNLLRAAFNLPSLSLNDLALARVNTQHLPKTLDAALQLVNNAPAVRAFELQADAVAQNLYSTVGSSAPNIDLVYEIEKFTDYAGVSGEQDNSSAMLRMNWTLGPGIGQVSLASAKFHEHEAAVNSYAAALQDNQSLVYRQWADLDSFDARLQAAEAIYSMQVELYTDTHTGYISGNVSLSDVLKAAAPALRTLVGIITLHQQRDMRRIDFAETIGALTMDTLQIAPDTLIAPPMDQSKPAK